MKGNRLTALLGVVALVLAVAPAASAETVDTGIDMMLVKTVDKAVASPGDTLTYTLTASHAGPSAPLQAAVVDTLPAGVTFVSASAGCTETTPGVVECLTGPWLPNDPRTYSITVTIDAGASGTLYNVATVDHRDPRENFPEDSDPSNNTDDAETVIPEPELGSIGDFVWLDADGDGVQDAGEAGIAGITVTLSGDATASATTDAGGLYSFGDLPAGSYTVVVGAGPAGHTPTTPAIVDVTLAAGEAYLDADFGFVPPPDPIIDLELVKSTPTPFVTVGDTATFSITVTNQGPDDATGVVVADTLPAGLTFVSSTAGTEAAGVITVPVGQLAAGADFVFSVTVTVDAVGVFTNAAEVTAADQEDSDSTPGDGQGDDYDTADVEASQVLANNSIGDFVWLDTDGDGVQDSGETGISGATVTISGPSGSSSTTTAADGKYLFSALDDGTYTITIDTSSVSDDYDLTTVSSYSISVAGGESNLTADFGFTEVLPVTGGDTGPLSALGLGLIALGAALLGVARRRADSI